MKKLVFIAGLSLCVVQGLRAQPKTDLPDKEVPQTVQKAFNSQYPNTAHVDWTAKQASYKVRFMMNDTKHLAVYNSAGTMVQTGVAIPKEDLPSVVNNAIARDYGEMRTGDYYRIKKDDQTIFLVEIEGLTEHVVVYDEEGNVIELKNSALR